eukprot:6198415-Pleurochrysis_carterae.AAC.4
MGKPGGFRFGNCHEVGAAEVIQGSRVDVVENFHRWRHVPGTPERVDHGAFDPRKALNMIADGWRFGRCHRT